MRRPVGISLLLLFLLFFLPWLWGEPSQATLTEDPPPEEEPEQTEPSPPPSTVVGTDRSTTLRVLVSGQLRQMDLEAYLLGVVRAEMPASFELEALKAQAVAARTYTLYKELSGGSANHPEADACDDITCCQAYKTYEEAALDWGAEAEAYEAKIRQAVEETDGQYVLYEGAPVLAVFHSSSVGTTQDAAAVWSGSLPYLQSVETPEGEETVPGYRSTASFTAAELKALLQDALPEADLNRDPSNWFTNIRQQSSGTVTALAVGGVEISGHQLRTALGLRSACFTISFDADTITFSVSGYGHGVGLSQYGANVLAAGGMDYQEILSWYYTGTEVGPYQPPA
ncbi:MAG: stage II sporulation protein D [Oscillospiraceae bacterium]|nr:stage II sporulation protein D [Oscillospiraceae bacterium]